MIAILMCHLLVSNVCTPSLGHLNEECNFLIDTYNTYICMCYVNEFWCICQHIPLHLISFKSEKKYDQEQMCKFFNVKPKSNWHVEHLLIWQTMGYMRQAYKYNRNFHLNKIPMEY
jgi:hypothetical protein